MRNTQRAIASLIIPEGLEIPENPFALLGEWEKNITAKDDVIAKLKESFEYVGGAIRSIEDLETEVAIFFPTPSSKRSYILILQSHAHEHLGQSIAYTRSLGITPPWSQQQPPSDDDGSDEGSEGDMDEDEGDMDEDEGDMDEDEGDMDEDEG